MSCEICGRNNCTRSFHSFEDQDNFDNIEDEIKDRMRNILLKQINNLDYEDIDGKIFINIDDVEKIINNY